MLIILSPQEKLDEELYCLFVLFLVRKLVDMCFKVSRVYIWSLVDRERKTDHGMLWAFVRACRTASDMSNDF